MMWAKTKEQEFAANQDFALLRSTINDQLLTLEIISHTHLDHTRRKGRSKETKYRNRKKTRAKKKDKRNKKHGII